MAGGKKANLTASFDGNDGSLYEALHSLGGAWQADCLIMVVGEKMVSELAAKVKGCNGWWQEDCCIAKLQTMTTIDQCTTVTAINALIARWPWSQNNRSMHCGQQ
eukprot:1138851-Pelagomonas_calceolata.AAC.2